MNFSDRIRLSGIGAAIAVLALLATAAPAQAAVIVDQEVDLPGSGFNDLGVSHWQSFMQAGDNIAGAAVRIDSLDSNGAPVSGAMTLSILDGAPDAGGDLLVSGTASVATATPAPDDELWFTVFWAPVAVVPETELFLQLASDNSLISIVSINSSPYVRGTQYLDGVPSSGGGKSKGKDADLAFRTFTDTAVTTALPEPGPVMMLGLGIAAITVARRRKSR